LDVTLNKGETISYALSSLVIYKVMYPKFFRFINKKVYTMKVTELRKRDRCSMFPGLAEIKDAFFYRQQTPFILAEPNQLRSVALQEGFIIFISNATGRFEVGILQRWPVRTGSPPDSPKPNV
jgi:hypothetical protein